MSSSLIPSLVPANCERQRGTQEHSNELGKSAAVATHTTNSEGTSLCSNNQLHDDNNNSILNTTPLSVGGAAASNDTQLAPFIALPCLPYLASCESEAATPAMNTALEDVCNVVAQQASRTAVGENQMHAPKCHAMTPKPSERNPRSLAPPSPSSKIQERAGHVSLVRTRSRALKSSSSSRSPPPHPQDSAPRVLLDGGICDGHALSLASKSKGSELSAQRGSRARSRAESSVLPKPEGGSNTFSYRSAARSPAHVSGGDGVDVDKRVAKKSRSEYEGSYAPNVSLYRTHSEENEAADGSKIGNKTDDVSPLPRPSRGSIPLEVDCIYRDNAPTNDNDDLINEEGRQLFQQQRGQLSYGSTSTSVQRFPAILSVPPPLPISNPQTPPMPRALFVACKLCGLSSPFCAQNGKPHVPVAPCIKCGLSTAFCPLTGGAHDLTAAEVHGLASPTSDNEARVGPAAIVDSSVADVELSIAAGGVGVPSALPLPMSHYVPASTLSASLARRSGTVGPSTSTSELSTSDKRRSNDESEADISSAVVTEKRGMLPNEFLGTAAEPNKATVAQPPLAMNTSTARLRAAVSAPPRAAGVGVLSRTKAKALLGVEGGTLVNPTHTDHTDQAISARKAIASGSAKLSSALRKPPLGLAERPAKAPTHFTAAANVVMAVAKKSEQAQDPSSTLATVGSARTASKSSPSPLPVAHSVTPRVAGLATKASEARRAEAAAKRSAAVSTPAVAASGPRGGGIGPKSAPSLSSTKVVTPPPRPANSLTDFTKATPTPPTRTLPQKVPLVASAFSPAPAPLTSRSQHLSAPSQTPPGQHVAALLTTTKKLGDTATQQAAGMLAKATNKASSKLSSHPSESPPFSLSSSSSLVVPADRLALTTSVIDSEALTLAEYATTMMTGTMPRGNSDVGETEEEEEEEREVSKEGEREVFVFNNDVTTNNVSTCTTTTTLPLLGGDGAKKASFDDVGIRRVVLKPAKSFQSAPKVQMSEGILQLKNHSGQDDEASVAAPKTESQTISRAPTINNTPKTPANSSAKPKRPALPSCAACLKVIRPPKSSPSSENSSPAVGKDAAEGRASTPNIADNASTSTGTTSSSTIRGIGESAPPSLKHVVSCSVCHRHYHSRCFLENAGTAATTNAKNTSSPLLLQSKSSTDDIFEGGKGSAPFNKLAARGVTGEQLAAVPPAAWLSHALSLSVCQVCLSDVVRIDELLSDVDSERSGADGGGKSVDRTETLLSDIITGQAPATTPAHHLIQLLINGYTSIPLLHERLRGDGCTEGGECVARGSSGTDEGDYQDITGNQEGREEHSKPRDDKKQPHEGNTTGKEASLEASLARLKRMAERLYKSLLMSHEIRADNYPNSTPSLESGYSNFRMRGEGRYEMVAPFFLETLTPIITNEANCGIMSVLRRALNTGGQDRGAGVTTPTPNACASTNTCKREINVCTNTCAEEEDAATATGISSEDLYVPRSSGETTAALSKDADSEGEATDNAGEAEDEPKKKGFPEKVLLSVLRSVPLRPMSSGCFYSTCGSEHQNWHTDGPSLLGGEGEGVSEENLHHQPTTYTYSEVSSITEGGQTLLPYAINVFVPLVPMNNKNGTEFVPGSHLSSKVKAVLKAALMAREGPMRVRSAATATKSEGEIKEEAVGDVSHGDLRSVSTTTVVCSPPCVDDSDDNAAVLVDGARTPTTSETLHDQIILALTTGSSSVPPSFNEAQWEKHFKSKTSPTVALGNALLFDYRVEHRGLGNKAYHDRPCVYMTYAQPWYIDTYNFDGKRYAHTLELPEGWHMDRAERAARKRNENEMRTDV